MGFFDDLIPAPKAPSTPTPVREPMRPSNPPVMREPMSPGFRANQRDTDAVGQTPPRAEAPLMPNDGNSFSLGDLMMAARPQMGSMREEAPSSDLGSVEMTVLDRTLRSAGFEGADNAVLTQEIMGLVKGGMDVQSATRYALENVQREGVVTNPPGTALSRLFGLDDGVPDAVDETKGPVTGITKPQATNLPAPKSKAEMDALAPGTKFVAPDGSVRVKP